MSTTRSSEHCIADVFSAHNNIITGLTGGGEGVHFNFLSSLVTNPYVK